MVDVFGGVKGDEKATVNPFAIDRENALKQLRLAIDVFEGRRVKKKSILQSMRDGTYGEEEKLANWEYNKVDEKKFDIILRWSSQEIQRVKNLERKEARIALNGLKVFYETINTNEPDFSHPDIAKCFNITARKHNLKLVLEPKELNREIHRHPFAGVIGDLRDLKNNLLAKEVMLALEEVDLALGLLEVVDLPHRKRDPKFRLDKTKLISPTFNEIFTHYDLQFLFADKIIQKEENVPVHRAKVAMASLRGWLKKIDVEMPNLKDETLKICYEALKIKTKPSLNFEKDKRLLAMDDGGTSFWSDKQHRWIKGYFNKNGEFVPPDWAL